MSIGAFMDSGMLRGMSSEEAKIMTVKGPVEAVEAGVILSHEHILVDFIGAEQTGYHRWDKDEVVKAMLPLI